LRLRIDATRAEEDFFPALPPSPALLDTERAKKKPSRPDSHAEFAATIAATWLVPLSGEQNV